MSTLTHTANLGLGFEILVGETVAPGQTISRRIAINVGKGSALINHGTVKNC